MLGELTMKTTKTTLKTTLALSVALLTSVTALLLAGTASASGHALSLVDEMADLRARFESRDPQILALKKTGTIGETYLGFLDAPGALPGEAQSLMADENTDRKKLYELIAKKEGATVEAVAERAARRNFNKAAKGEMLKTPTGWRPR
jgi:uncharacterized protein YdbL (DUF1318 family)